MGGNQLRWACLMGRGMDYGLRGPYMRLGPVIVLCSWARHVNLIVTLSAQENKQKGLGAEN